MLKFFGLIFMILLLASCSAHKKSKLKLSVSNITAAGVNMPGGMMLYGRNKTTLLNLALNFKEGENTTILDNGDWEFFVMAWQGPNNMEGLIKCGEQNLFLDGVDAELNITITNAKCHPTIPENSKFLGPNQFKALTFWSCNSAPSLPSIGADCSVSTGNIQSLKINLLSDDPLSPLTSICYNLTSGSALTNLHIPVGGVLVANFPTTINAYNSTDCIGANENFNYPSGLYNSLNSNLEFLASISTFASDINNAKVFLETSTFLPSTPPVATAVVINHIAKDIEEIVTLNYSDADGDLATACTLLNPFNITETTICSCDIAGVCTVGIQGTTSFVGSASFDYTVTANSQPSTLINSSFIIKQPFVSVWNTISPSETITLPLPIGYSYDFKVDWGDGSSDIVTSYNDVNASHIYTNSGNHTITIYGLLQSFRMGGHVNSSNLTQVINLGDVGWLDLSSAFKDCTNLTNFSGGITTNVTNMSQMFANASSLVNLDVSSFDTSSVTNMSQMFLYTTALTNLNISNFITDSVTNMSAMFKGMSLISTLDLTTFSTALVIPFRLNILGRV